MDGSFAGAPRTVLYANFAANGDFSRTPRVLANGRSAATVGYKAAEQVVTNHELRIKPDELGLHDHIQRYQRGTDKSGGRGRLGRGGSPWVERRAQSGVTIAIQ
jgi:hypothetical protein